MKPTITLSLDLGWGQTITVTREISEDIIRRAYQTLDYATPDAGIAAIFCTDPGTVQTVVRIRKDAASLIAKVVSHALIETMERRDTLMGYPIERESNPKGGIR